MIKLEKLRPVAPLLIVTACAMYGQIAFAVDAMSPPSMAFPLRLLIAVVVAVGVESMALYVQWHAHDALLRKATATAARRRRASYAIALAVAGVNFAHFYKVSVPAAVVFALFSAAGPWLWGMHTRRLQHLQLRQEGKLDEAGAVFSAERWRHFPLRTLGARRWSIDYGITDPRMAVESYRTELQRRRAAYANQRVLRSHGIRARFTRRFFGTPIRPAEVPALERYEDEVVTTVDDKGVAQHHTARPVEPKPQPAPSSEDAPRMFIFDPSTGTHEVWETPAAESKSAPKPRRRRGGKSGFLANPPAVAVELAKTGQFGWELYQRELLEKHGIEISDYAAKEMVRPYRTNGHKVTS